MGDSGAGAIKHGRARYDKYGCRCDECVEGARAHWRKYRTIPTPEQRKVRYERRQAVMRAAKDVPCTDCGVKYPFYVMQFDHISDDKSFTISKRVHNTSSNRLLEEIAKCEVVCANCHAIRTFNRAFQHLPH